jgi:hypothetical protein
VVVIKRLQAPDRKPEALCIRPSRNPPSREGRRSLPWEGRVGEPRPAEDFTQAAVSELALDTLPRCGFRTSAGLGWAG